MAIAITPNSTVAEAKQALRERMLAARDRLTPAQREAAGRAVADALTTHPWWRASGTVALFVSIQTEMPTAELLDRAWGAGRHVALPRLERHEGRLSLAFHAVSHRDELNPGVWGIPEPRAEAPLVKPGQMDLWIVPGLSFDRLGGRLGYGKALYDRALTGVSAPTVGIGYAFQRVEALPLEAHDVRLRAIVTEEGWHSVTNGPEAA